MWGFQNLKNTPEKHTKHTYMLMQWVHAFFDLYHVWLSHSSKSDDKVQMDQEKPIRRGLSKCLTVDDWLSYCSLFLFFTSQLMNSADA